MKSRSVVVFLVGSEAGDDNNVILARGWTQKSGLRSIHFLTLIVKCSVTTCINRSTVLDLSLWHQDGGASHSIAALSMRCVPRVAYACSDRYV